MPPIVSYSHDVPTASQAYALGTDDGDSGVLKRYLRDVRRYAVLSREHERAFAKQCQESREQWQALCLEHLLHVPLLLHWWSRLRRGAMPMQTLCRTSPMPHPADLQATIQRWHALRRQIRHVGQQRSCQAQTVATLRQSMRELLPGWEWPLKFFQHTWQRFAAAMTQAAANPQSRAATHYVSALGYSLEELQQLWRQGEHLCTLREQAKQEIVTHNLRLVVHIACKYRHTGLPLSDLIQEGSIGLIRAVDGFDYRRELKFSTYAFWRIRQAIYRARTTQAFMRLPEYVHEHPRPVRPTDDLLGTEFGGALRTPDLADHFDMPFQHHEPDLENAAADYASFDSLWPSQHRLLNHASMEQGSPSSHDHLIQTTLRRYTQQALRCLTPREVAIISRRFGLDNQPIETLEQIGHTLHLSRERVRQIANEALHKLKNQKAMALAAEEL